MRPIARPPGSAVSETASTNQKWPKHRLLRPLLLAPRPTLQNRLTTPPCGRPGTHAPSVGAVRLNLGGQRGEKTWNFKALVKLCQTAKHSQTVAAGPVRRPGPHSSAYGSPARLRSRTHRLARRATHNGGRGQRAPASHPPLPSGQGLRGGSAGRYATRARSQAWSGEPR